MPVPVIPDWFRIILLVLTFLSFLPQLSRLFSRKDSSGISTYYMLFNLISATEQFTLGFFYVVNTNNLEGSDFFVNQPVNRGDWLNLAQMALVWVLWLVFFISCLYFPSDHRDASKTFVSAIYFAFLLISVVPVFADAINPDPSEYHKWFGALFHGCHTLFLNPVVTILNIAALFVQAREMRLRPSSQGLSLLGLGVQAIVFIIVALSWIWRIKFPYELIDKIYWNVLVSWYQLVGWVAVDSAIFAVVQAVLLWIVSRQPRGEDDQVTDDETEPLLSDGARS